MGKEEKPKISKKATSKKAAKDLTVTEGTQEKAKKTTVKIQTVKAVKIPAIKTVKTVKAPVVKTVKTPTVKTVKTPTVKTKTVKIPPIKTVKIPEIKTVKIPEIKTVKIPAIKTVKIPEIKTVVVRSIRIGQTAVVVKTSVKIPVKTPVKTPIKTSVKTPIKTAVKVPVKRAVSAINAPSNIETVTKEIKRAPRRPVSASSSSVSSSGSGKKYYCYFIISGNKTYNGYTVDLTRRLRQHNGIIQGGAKSTRCGKGGWEYLAVLTAPNWTAVRAMQVEWLCKYPTRKKPRPRIYSRPQGRVNSLGEVCSRLLESSDTSLTLHLHENYYDLFCNSEQSQLVPSFINIKCGFSGLKIQ